MTHSEQGLGNRGGMLAVFLLVAAMVIILFYMFSLTLPGETQHEVHLSSGEVLTGVESVNLGYSGEVIVSIGNTTGVEGINLLSPNGHVIDKSDEFAGARAVELSGDIDESQEYTVVAYDDQGEIVSSIQFSARYDYPSPLWPVEGLL